MSHGTSIPQVWRSAARYVTAEANQALYQEVSDRIIPIVAAGADAFEHASVDEAYLDLSSLGSMERSKVHARSLKAAILAREGRGRPALMAARAAGGRSS